MSKMNINFILNSQPDCICFSAETEYIPMVGDIINHTMYTRDWYNNNNNNNSLKEEITKFKVTSREYMFHNNTSDLYMNIYMDGI